MRRSGLVVPPARRRTRRSMESSSPSARRGLVGVGRGADARPRRRPRRLPPTAGSWVEVDEERLLVCRVTELLGVMETVDEPSGDEAARGRLSDE